MAAVCQRRIRPLASQEVIAAGPATTVAAAGDRGAAAEKTRKRGASCTSTHQAHRAGGAGAE
jgi:hypothetical protein